MSPILKFVLVISKSFQRLRHIDISALKIKAHILESGYWMTKIREKGVIYVKYYIR
jgi:Zn-dependent M16 (insulinase) family peptidase